jgi:sulfur carrier protein ThiS
MRMHRGSSKGVRAVPGPTGTLPLSASPPAITIRVELTRASTVLHRTVRVPPGTLVRAVLRDLGEPAEGSAVLLGDQPVPLDTPLDRPVRLIVLPTFSGG